MARSGRNPIVSRGAKMIGEAGCHGRLRIICHEGSEVYSFLMFSQHLVNGITGGSVYAVIALG